MDEANSIKLYTNEMEMVGDPIEVKIGCRPGKISFKTKIIRSHHVEGDPSLECSAYTVDNSYNDCIQNELLGLFEEEIACQPPPF